MKPRRPMKLPESRLQSLYKDFRPLRDLNPDGYNANVNTWKQYLSENYLATSDNILLECGNSLLQKLTIDVYGCPQSIDCVIDSLVEDQSLIPIEEFKTHKELQSTLPALWKWLAAPLAGNRKFTSRFNETSNAYLKEIKFVIRSILDKKFHLIQKFIQENIIANITGLTDCVFTVSEFCSRAGFNEFLTGIEEKDVMIDYLANYKNIVRRDGQTVKIIDPTVSHIVHNFSKSITTNDHRIASLNGNISNIRQQVQKLEDRLSTLGTMLKSEHFHKDIPREAQREYLKAKLLSEKYLSRLLKFMNNLLQVKAQIDVSLNNATLFQVLSDSNNLIKSVNEYVGSTEKVGQLLDDIQEQSLESENIHALLTSSHAGQHSIVDDEVDKELQILEDSLKKEPVQEVPTDDTKDVLDRLSSLELKTRLPAIPSRETKQDEKVPVAE